MSAEVHVFAVVPIVCRNISTKESRIEAVGQISFGLEPNRGFLHF